MNKYVTQMISEIWTMAKMLVTSKPSERMGCDMDIIVMDHFPFASKTVMSWCGRIIVRTEKKDLLLRFLQTKNGIRLLTHEGGHVIQAVHHGGSWIGYYLRYLWNWVKHGFMSPISANYYINKYECEAFANEERPDYWKNYRGSDIEKYEIPNAKNIYRLLCSPESWKEFVKKL